MVLETRPASSRKSTDIAVIGIGCLFPDANGLEEFWQGIKQGHDAIGPIPLSHWRPEDYFDADPKKPDHTYAQTGGFIKPYAFDPLKFGIAPHALEATDSTQLLGMVCAHEALVDAGYGPERNFDRDRVSCVIGVTGTLELVIPLGARLGHPIWKAALDKAGVPAEQAQQVMDEISSGYVSWQEASFPGLLGNVVAGRIASRLDLGGTNSVVDAACASSLAAVHLAAMELESGRADMVITGGMDTFNDIFMYMCFSKTPALSPSGAARPYDANGDGTILGEGLGAIILKRLDDAERDGDRIYAVLRSVGSSSDGKGQAIYAPSAKGQTKALTRAYEQAGVSARSIELVEGHGTGTKVGDGVELEALTRVYREADADAVWCQLGSVKSQIGHTKAAAGAAGLIKAVMALHHKVLPPTIKVTEAHPKLVGSPFIISDKARPWVGHQSWPRRAAVSAFGFGGSNYHAVLEEFRSEKTALDWDPELQVLAFSADAPEGLLAAVREARSLVEQGWSGRGLGRKLRREFRAEAAERLCFIVSGHAQLQERLAAAVEALTKPEGKDPLWLYRGRGGAPGPLAFIFAGQGSQEPGMLRELCCLFPEFLTSLQQGNEVLQNMEPEALRLSDRIHPGQAFDETQHKEQRQQLTETRYAQLALGTLGTALTDVLGRFGVKPDAVAGHSYGELLALQAAGVLERTDLLRLSYERGRLMKTLGKPNGAMLAVMASEADIQRVLSENGLELEWANFNADKQVVLGADAELCQKAAAAFKKAGISSRALEVSTAFHTSFVEPAADAFLEALQAVEFRAPSARVYANLSGGLYPESTAEQKRILSRQLAQPVRFAAMLRQMQADGVRTFIEVGPQKKLSGLLKAAVGEAVCLSLDADATSSLAGLGQVLAQLASLGYPVRLSAWDEGPDLPRPTQQKSFTVMISGANYKNPQKPKAAKREAGQGAQASVNAAPAKASMAPARPADRQPSAHAASLNPTAKAVPAASAKLSQHHAPREAVHSPTSQGVSSESKVRFPQEGTMSSSNDSWQRLEKIMQDMHDIQRKTADAHTLFLENQRQFQAMLQGLMRGEAMPAASEPMAPARYQSPAPAPISKPAPEVKTTAPAAANIAVPRAPATQTSAVTQSTLTAYISTVDHKPAASHAPAKAHASSASQAAHTSAASHAPARPAASADHSVYEVLASCTGYPAELLKPEMNLESDLGIDSIKKVEIFSQLQSHHPHMEGDASRLGELQTIGDLLQLASQGQALDHSPRVGAWAAGTVALAASPVAQDQQTILEIVAEKTGFPMSMLQPAMDLEADLGIDSIKKVEIFSVVQERIPHLAGLSAETLNTLRTIDDMFGLLGGIVDEGYSEDEPTPLTKILSSEADGVVFQILAEKTGYPQEVLTPTMSLESDLGIDSIKRVEIFSALAEVIPGLQNATQVQVGTLEKVSDFLRLAHQGIGDAEQLAEQSLLEPDHRHADWDLSKKKNPVESFAAKEAEHIRVGAAAKEAEHVRVGAAAQEAEHVRVGAAAQEAEHVRIGAAAREAEHVRVGAAAKEAEHVRIGAAAREAEHVRIGAAAQEAGHPGPETTAEEAEHITIGVAAQETEHVRIEATGQDAGHIRAETPPEVSEHTTVGVAAHEAEHVRGGATAQEAEYPRPETTAEEAEHVRDGVAPQVLETTKAGITVDEAEHIKVAAEPVMAARSGGRLLSLADALDADEIDDGAVDQVQHPLDSLHLQRLEIELFQPQGHSRTWKAGTEVWIGDDGSNLARNIMLKLQERGLQARLVSLAQAERLQVPEVLHGLILLAPLKLDVPPVRWLGQAFRLLRRCGHALNAFPEQSLVAVVTRNGGRFGLDGLQNSTQVFGGALSALAKTVAEEWKGVHARALDLGRDFTDGIEAALRCLDGILLQGPVELGINREQIFQITLHDHEFESQATPESSMKPGDLILVTGGARGVTATSLIPLAKAWQPRFVIWGRTALGDAEPAELRDLKEPAALKRALLQQNPQLTNPRELEAAYRQLIQQRELHATIAQLESLGATVIYEAVDVSKEAELRQAFQNLTQAHGTPVGIIHGAGVIRDKWILDQKDEEFFEVLDTKLRILPYIEDCAKKGLRWALLFSSSTARLGRKGQVAYGVANEALNKFAQYISAQFSSCHALAFNWGPWAGGMVNDGLKKIFAAEGVATIPLEAGAALVQRVIALPPRQVHELVVLAHAEPLVARQDKSNRQLTQFHINVTDVPVLLDHVIKQRAVVPAALLLEWMAAAAQAQDPEKKILKIKDFKVWKGIVLDADQDLPVWIEQSTDAASENLELILCSQSLQRKKLRHARAQFVMGSPDQTKTVPASTALPLDPLCQGLNPYAEILFHGDDLHLITSIRNCAPEGVDATLNLGHKPQDWSHVGLPEAWLISGEVVDAVFQAAIVWSTLQQGKPCLPSQVGQVEILRPLPEHGCRLQLRIRRAEPLRLVADAELINDQNEVIMRFKDVEAVLDAGLAQAFRQTKLGSVQPGIGAL
ncbi:type I polyketide synthase [Oligoflexus tunisiensis]|uniref:type I polyketide synthase n=1 Tax=Oligoflexus tunisiensis TaxID=708132 RepID=UPI000AB40384|nr:type I polyketide synthase [Oligoflexus tunisiensis]